MPKAVSSASARSPDLPHSLDRPDLAHTWQRAFGRPLPPRLYKATVVMLLAYRLQELALGGLSPALSRHLRDLVPRAGRPAQPPPRRLKPGTRLLRDWQGRTHTVTVVENGFLYAGTTYRSLSVIARQITGTPWSGPAFFGLRKAA